MAELFPLFSLFFYFWRWRVSTEGSCRGPPNSHLFLFLTFPAPHLERRKRKWWQTGYVMYKFPSRRQLTAVATWIYDGLLFYFLPFFSWQSRRAIYLTIDPSIFCWRAAASGACYLRGRYLSTTAITLPTAALPLPWARHFITIDRLPLSATFFSCFL